MGMSLILCSRWSWQGPIKWVSEVLLRFSWNFRGFSFPSFLCVDGYVLLSFSFVFISEFAVSIVLIGEHCRGRRKLYVFISQEDGHRVKALSWFHFKRSGWLRDNFPQNGKEIKIWKIWYIVRVSQIKRHWWGGNIQNMTSDDGLFNHMVHKKFCLFYCPLSRAKHFWSMALALDLPWESSSQKIGFILPVCPEIRMLQYRPSGRY